MTNDTVAYQWRDSPSDKWKVTDYEPKHAQQIESSEVYELIRRTTDTAACQGDTAGGATWQARVVHKIMRDACELDPASINDDETIAIRYEDLQQIVLDALATPREQPTPESSNAAPSPAAVVTDEMVFRALRAHYRSLEVSSLKNFTKSAIADMRAALEAARRGDA